MRPFVYTALPSKVIFGANVLDRVAEEIAALQTSMDIIEHGIAGEMDAARPGVMDWEVWAAAQYAMMRNGCSVSVSAG